MPKIVTTREQVTRAKHLYALGFSVKDTAKHLLPPLHEQTLVYHLRKAGVLRTRAEATRGLRSRQLRSQSTTNRRYGQDNYAWKGDRASPNAGRQRAHRLYPGAPERCEGCASPSSITKQMHRHHVDGNTLNNARKNVQWLCTQCHHDAHPLERLPTRHPRHGVTKTQHDWAAGLGLSLAGLRKRLRDGWALELAMTKQKRGH